MMSPSLYIDLFSPTTSTCISSQANSFVLIYTNLFAAAPIPAPVHAHALGAVVAAAAADDDDDDDDDDEVERRRDTADTAV